MDLIWFFIKTFLIGLFSFSALLTGVYFYYVNQEKKESADITNLFNSTKPQFQNKYDHIKEQQQNKQTENKEKKEESK